MLRRDLLQGLGAGAVGLLLRPSRAGAAGLAVAPGSRSGLPWRSGVAQNDPAFAEQFARWRGRPIDLVTHWGRWDHFDDVLDLPLDERFTGFFSTAWKAYHHVPLPALVSFSCWPKKEAAVPKHDPSRWDAAAAGELDTAFRATARKFALMLDASAHPWIAVRLFWEANGGWYPHAIKGRHEAYKEVHRRFADMLREEAARRTAKPLHISWDPSQQGREDVEAIWPGGDHVDAVCPSLHDKWAHRSEEEFDTWSRSMDANGPVGLRAWLDFARSRDKPLGLSEYGILTRADRKSKVGGDNPVYIEGCFRFLKENASSIVWETYFNSSDGRLEPRDDVPLAAAAYKRLWGGA